MADEEDEDEVCDSWEDMADSGELERRMEERNKVQMEMEQKQQSVKQEEQVPVQAVFMQDDTNRTQYKPQLRILKRPESGKDSKNLLQDKNDQPVRKSLAERQAQYAEARARILGSACDGGEETSSLTEDEIIGASSFTYVHKTEETTKLPVPENVVRQPIGPDGTKGFHTSR